METDDRMPLEDDGEQPLFDEESPAGEHAGQEVAPEDALTTEAGQAPAPSAEAAPIPYDESSPRK
ncbi:MAG TPA: hypothetical protein VH640_00815, partial [Bryobacteraceae bacterium]